MTIYSVPVRLMPSVIFDRVMMMGGGNGDGRGDIAVKY
jgi:hypothetical protein